MPTNRSSLPDSFRFRETEVPPALSAVEEPSNTADEKRSDVQHILSLPSRLRGIKHVLDDEHGENTVRINGNEVLIFHPPSNTSIPAEFFNELERSCLDCELLDESKVSNPDGLSFARFRIFEKNTTD